MSALVGTWNYVSQENLDGYMEAIGVPEQMREIAKESKPLLEITQDAGDHFMIRTTVGDKVKEYKFVIGQAFDSVSLTGQPLKSVVVLEGEKMVETQTLGDFNILIERSVEEGNLVSRMTVNNVTATVVFSKA
ncbi:fatty acid-binding protein, adipocyte-like [Haliotis rufescens]|uniref:fatty acid-binding protein, adipocyte-like n=1 Tax=Haliotis rufescens TaxID=6454 RepID=UPI001EAFB5E3|nr:fatty acid-binding protein, adipocyte-like [Haliotis rufescens]